MTRIEEEIARWHDEAFGEMVDVPATYRKLLEEVGELGEALIHSEPHSVEEELGDIAFVLVHLIRVCTEYGELHSVLASALDKNLDRLNKTKGQACCDEEYSVMPDGKGGCAICEDKAKDQS